MALRSFLSQPDPRPVLVSVLGAAWIIMGGFGLMRGAILLAGVSQGIEVGHYDPNEELAETYPEFVDEAWFEARAQREEFEALQRRAGGPQLAFSLLAILGGVRLLQRKRWSRLIVVLAGVGVIVASAVGSWQVLQITLQPTADMELPPDVGEAFWSFAAINVLLQSLPVLIGMSLLYHRLVREWVAARGRS